MLTVYERVKKRRITRRPLLVNYYGTKRTAEALIPLLQLSDSPRIVNVSSSAGKLVNIPKERVDEVLTQLLKDFKEGFIESKGWPVFPAYTRILAKKYPNFRINSVSPDYVKTDINFNTGILSVVESAASVLKLALLPFWPLLCWVSSIMCMIEDDQFVSM
ncbi:hypothetical protein PRUPE_1G171800 [Prunus persica]|uniref:Alcohol-forming fatty acyl-CoA reductase n=1 Tax=Prunus persica TaxID=3760 RepID=A0A251QYV4_PRUPE|nr:hypothetical protein PRUPE_1G171800 [Prunus persica]